MKQLMVARVFPAYHPQKGEQTRFVEKILVSIAEKYSIDTYNIDKELGFSLLDKFGTLPPKHHTIRSGKRWKTGDQLQLKVWSGKPYNSKTITITPPLTLTVYDFQIDKNLLPTLNGNEIGIDLWATIARNDGLSTPDFLKWFIPDVKKFEGFSGQILAWGDVKY